MRIQNGYCFFWKAKIANWHLCEFTMICLDNIERTFTSSEQAFMYLKAELFNDKLSQETILKEQHNQKLIQELGRKVLNFNNDIWIKYREELMFKACYSKFKNNIKEKEEILKYKGLKFVEASPYDLIWGVGLEENDDLILNENNWKGLNLLGKCLNKVMETIE